MCDTITAQRGSVPRSAPHRLRTPLAAAAAALLAALAVCTVPPPVRSQSPASLSLDRLMFVDCLLPAPVRQLGGKMTYQGPRHAVRATVDDCQIRGGEYVAYDRANYATALKVWLPEAERGDEQAEIYVGEIYEKGLGTDPDYARAAQWYEKAAKQNSKQGMSHLAYLYEQGFGVPKDPVRALNLYKSAAGITGADLQLVFESDITAANSRIDELTSQLEARTSELTTLRDQLQKTQVELESAQAAGAQARRGQEALRRKVTALESQPPATADAQELGRLRSELQRRDQDVKEQEARISLLQQNSDQQNAALIQRLAEVQRDDSALKTQLGSARAEASALRSQLAAAQARQTALEQESTRVKDEAQKSERALQKAQTDLRNTPPEPKASEDPRLRTALAAAQVDLQRQRAAIENLDAERGKLADEVKHLQSELRDAAGREQHTSGDASTTRAQLASLQAELLERNRRVDALSATIAAGQSQIAKDREQLSQLTSRLGSQDAEVQRLNKALLDRETALSRDKVEREGLAAEVKTYQGQVTTLNAAVKNLQQTQAATGSTARAQLDNLQAELLERNRRIDALSATIAAGQSQAAKDREQLSQLTSRLGAQDAEVQRLNKALLDRESALNRDKAEKEALAAEVKNYQAQVATLTPVTKGPVAAARPPPSPPIAISSSELGIAASYALVIANSRYQNARDYPTLPSVEKDATDVRNALQRYGFKGPPILSNPSGQEMETAIAKLLSSVGDRDSVLIYYTGHGEIMESTSGAAVESTTYWLPRDADPNNRASWVSTGWVTDMIKTTRARHVLVVADSCYAGAMVRTTNLKVVSNRPAAEPERIRLLAKLTSRTLLTSGGKEPVLSNGPGGNSVFARVFTDILNQNKGVLDASSLYDSLVDGMQQAFGSAAPVSADRAAQRPRYAVLAGAGHLNGDFLFVPAPITVASLR